VTLSVKRFRFSFAAPHITDEWPRRVQRLTDIFDEGEGPAAGVAHCRKDPDVGIRAVTKRMDWDAVNKDERTAGTWKTATNPRPTCGA
jgi:hypothetical protein